MKEKIDELENRLIKDERNFVAFSSDVERTSAVIYYSKGGDCFVTEIYEVGAMMMPRKFFDNLDEAINYVLHFGGGFSKAPYFSKPEFVEG